MRYALLTVFFRHPFQNLPTPVVIKIDIDIRHRNTIGIKETLEQ